MDYKEVEIMQSELEEAKEEVLRLTLELKAVKAQLIDNHERAEVIISAREAEIERLHGELKDND